MKRKIMLVLILLVFSCSIAAVSAVDDANDNISDGDMISFSNDDVVYEDDLCSISQEENILLSFNESNAGSFEYLFNNIYSADKTLDLENDFAFNESMDSDFIGGIVIEGKENFVINGNNHIIDGKGLARIFSITSDNITLKNIQFKNAFTNATGGALNINANNVKLINCSFIDNTAEIESGAILLVGDYAYINNCTFINNSAKYTGAVLIRSHNGCITDSYFENNTAAISAAAIGLAFRNNTSIRNSVFVNNAAYNEGGAAIFVNGALNTKIINSTFIDNYAHYYGGAIFWSRGHNGSVINSTFINNTATEKGGAIYHLGDDITLTGNIFRDNAGVNGSAIYLNNGTNKELSKNVVLSNEIYINNVGDLRISDSIILDKIISTNSTVLFANNWFGNTKDNYNESLNNCADNWLYLDASVDNAMVGVDALIKFYFDQFNSSQSFNLPETILKLDAYNLVLDNDTVSIGESVNSCITDYGAYVDAMYENIKFRYVIPIDDINVFAENITKYYGNLERFVVSVLDSKSKPISNKTVYITINGVKYTRTTNENGTASVGINLKPGIYDVNTTVDNRTVDSVVTVLTTVNGTDITKVFRNDTQYYATFLDSEGKYLAEGTEIEFNINGVMYTRKVNEIGLAKLNINLQQGEYIITAINKVTGEMFSNNITVIPRIIENKDLTKYYRNDSQYVVKIIGDDGKAVGAGVNVTFNINGVLYTRTTNESGIAKMNVNLGAGDYIITAECGGCRVSNNITVLPILNATDLTKKYSTPDQFVATLVDGQGNPYVGQNVQFNINGVLYNRTTDGAGNAKLNINLQPGEYIITSSYNGFNIANTVKIMHSE
jgi:predicted outer membrane repeat protein